MKHIAKCIALGILGLAVISWIVWIGIIYPFWAVVVGHLPTWVHVLSAGSLILLIVGSASLSAHDYLKAPT